MKLKDTFPFVEDIATQGGDPWSVVPRERMAELCAELKDKHGFDCLSCLTGTDRGENFEVIYHLFSYERKETIVLKVFISKADPKVPSVSEIWSSADWMERETYDLLGIDFTGHPNLKRILLPDDWVGHPLCKDYKEREEYQAMATTRD